MPSEDGLKGSQNKTQDESLSKDSEAELKAINKGLSKLTTKEAYEVAVQRGLEAKEHSFRSSLRRNPNSYKKDYQIIRGVLDKEAKSPYYYDLGSL